MLKQYTSEFDSWICDIRSYKNIYLKDLSINYMIGQRIIHI